MFRHRHLHVWASILPVLMLVVSCAQTSAPTPLPNNYQGEGTDNEIANFITENACASRGGDADTDLICDNEDTCIGSEGDCNNNDVVDGKDPSWWDRRSDFEKSLMILTAAAGSWVGLNCAFGNSCWDFDAWFIHSDRHDEYLEFNFHDLERAASRVSFFPKDGNYLMTLHSTIKTSEDIGLSVNGNIKSLGRYASMCIHSKFALDFTGEADGEVKLQMQFTPKTSLSTGDEAVTKARFEEICLSRQGIWVATEKSSGLYYVSSLPPRSAGFETVGDQTSGTAVTTTRLNFASLNTLAAASFQFEEPNDATVTTHAYSPKTVASETQNSAFGTLGTQDRIRAALGYNLNNVDFSTATAPREYELKSSAPDAAPLTDEDAEAGLN